MAQTSLLPVPNQQFFDNNGNPLAGGKVYFYQPGTTTPKAVYSDSTGEILLSNPVILDAYGRASIWISGYYKVVLTDSLGTLLWTEDDVSSQYNSPLTNYQFITQGDVETYVGPTQFSVPGDRTTGYLIGQRIQATVGAGVIYGTITDSSYSGETLITTVTVIWDLGTLDSGLSTVALGIITPSNSSLPVIPVTTKSIGYSMAVTDINRIINANSANAMNLTLLDANAVPNGAWNWVQNKNSGPLTLVGTVNGVANYTLYNKDALFVYSDGANWYAPGSMMGRPPIGTIQWWDKSLTGVPQTLPYGWVECNGQTISDADSPLNGQTIRNINGGARFIRGSNVSGTTQANQILSHTHGATSNISGNIYVERYGDTDLVYTGPAYTSGNYGGQGIIYATTSNYIDISGGKYLTTSNSSNLSASVNVTSSGSSESRPDNISMVAIMRIK